jgi:hypothetical protein
VSNAFYVYLRDPDGHRVELYTSDYFTGDPDGADGFSQCGTAALSCTSVARLPAPG